MEVIQKAGPDDLALLLSMAVDLWPDYAADELSNTLAEILRSDRFNVLLFRYREEVAGFIYLGIRRDYVEGSDFTPTGYIEGIYVKPAFRRMGVANKLVAVGEQWCREKDCRQMGSDTYLDNQASYGFHLSAGFKEAARLITFIKDL